DMTAPVRSSVSLALVAGQCPTVREDHVNSYVTHNATAVQQQLMQQDTQHMPSETWCFKERYTAPETEQFCEPQAHVTVAVAPLDQLPAYGYGILDLYGGQIEFVNLSMQSPAAASSLCTVSNNSRRYVAVLQVQEEDQEVLKQRPLASILKSRPQFGLEMVPARPQCDACVKRSESCQYIETQQQSNQRRIHELEQEQNSKEQRIRELEKEQNSKEQRIRELEKEQNSKEQRIRELEEQILYEIPLECIKTAEQPSGPCSANSTKHHWSSIREEPATAAGKRPQTEVEKKADHFSAPKRRTNNTGGMPLASMLNPSLASTP
ncbi:hypothetical protein G3M48_001323, partial [Beauveria asiatica]